MPRPERADESNDIYHALYRGNAKSPICKPWGHTIFLTRRTTATLRELAIVFGLTHPDSVSNLIRRAEIAISASKLQRQALARIEELLQKQ